ncbi:MAG: YIP1 family protein, partial [Acutalibacteraceae bacterium]
STFFQDLFNVLLPLILWCIANWCLTSLMDGKGNFKDIFISVCYAAIPLCFVMLPAALLTNGLTLDEATIITYMMNIGYFWTGLLLVISSMTVHDYSFGKNILVCILTVVGMAIILFLAMLFLSVSNRLISFISGLISELSLRF